MAKRDKRKSAQEILQEAAGGEEMLNKILAQLPDDTAREAFLDALGDKALKQDEFSRAMDEARAEKEEAGKLKTTVEKWHETLNTWYAEKQDEIHKLSRSQEELEALRQSRKKHRDADDDDDDDQQVTRPAPQPKLPEGLVTRQDLDRVVGQMQAQGVALISGLTDLSWKHFKEFGTPLDMTELIKHSERVGKPIDQGGYDTFVGELREERSKKTHDSEIKEAEKRGAERTRLELTTSAPPYPVGDSAGFTGTLSGLNKDKRPETGVDAAVRNVLTRRQQAAGTPNT